MSRLALVLAAMVFATPLLRPPLASATLNATGTAVAGAYNVGDNGTTSLLPGPDSLRITAGAAASAGVNNPSPPPPFLEAEAIVAGSGISRHGQLSGRARAEGSSLPANGVVLASGQATLTLDFHDPAIVVSDTLPAGTPVTLTFAMTLDAIALHVLDGENLNPEGTGAAARFETEVRDVNDVGQFPGQGALVINSRGLSETFDTFTFQTEVGAELELVGELVVSAGVDIDFSASSFSQATAEVHASQAAFYYEPSGDVGLQTASGHDYAPEPISAGPVVACAALVALRSRRQR